MDLQHQEKPKQNQSQQTYKSQKNLTSDSEQNSTIPNTHFRVNSITQLQDKANQSAKVKSFEKLQSNANYSDALSQLQAFDKGLNKTTNSRTEPIQRNNTGIPDHLKSGMENVSGMSLDQVKVHYNSSKPASVQAHAYAQGNQVHLASGQEKHLPHELGHVVQQAQGRVKPTTQINGANINDDKKLEKEADILGKKALQQKAIEKTPKKPNFNFSSSKQLITDPEKARAYLYQGDENIKNQLLMDLENHLNHLHDAALKDAAPEIINDVLNALRLQFENMEWYDFITDKPKNEDRTPEEEEARNMFKRGTTHFNEMVEKYKKYLKFDHSGKMGLWSGGKMLSDYAHEYRGLKMLERTDFGLIFNDKPMVGWSNFADVMSGLWDALSSKFVELNKFDGMEVHVLLRNYEGDSTLNRQEIPQLKAAGANIFYHAIWGNDKGKIDTFREINGNIELFSEPSDSDDGVQSPGEATKRLILYVSKLEKESKIMGYTAVMDKERSILNPFHKFQAEEVHKNFREEFKDQQFPTDEASANDIARKIDEKENARPLPSKPE
jgi:hypothetical protein